MTYMKGICKYTDFYQLHMWEGSVFILSECVCLSVCVCVSICLCVCLGKNFECLNIETFFGMVGHLDSF